MDGEGLQLGHLLERVKVLPRITGIRWASVIHVFKVLQLPLQVQHFHLQLLKPLVHTRNVLCGPHLKRHIAGKFLPQVLQGHAQMDMILFPFVVSANAIPPAKGLDEE